MNEYCVVVANGSRARFFTLENSQIPEMESGPNLVECTDLSNPEHDLHGTDLWSENKSGRNRGSTSGQSHGYDDHRSQHAEEIEKRFAHAIADECVRMSRGKSDFDIVLVSQTRMLGHLRNAMESRLRGIRTQELAKDLSKLSPLELHSHLAKENLIPQRKNPARQKV